MRAEHINTFNLHFMFMAAWMTLYSRAVVAVGALFLFLLKYGDRKHSSSVSPLTFAVDLKQSRISSVVVEKDYK